MDGRAEGRDYTVYQTVGSGDCMLVLLLMGTMVDSMHLIAKQRQEKDRKERIGKMSVRACYTNYVKLFVIVIIQRACANAHHSTSIRPSNQFQSDVNIKRLIRIIKVCPAIQYSTTLLRFWRSATNVLLPLLLTLRDWRARATFLFSMLRLDLN